MLLSLEQLSYLNNKLLLLFFKLTIIIQVCYSSSTSPPLSGEGVLRAYDFKYYRLAGRQSRTDGKKEGRKKGRKKKGMKKEKKERRKEEKKE